MRGKCPRRTSCTYLIGSYYRNHCCGMLKTKICRSASMTSVIQFRAKTSCWQKFTLVKLFPELMDINLNKGQKKRLEAVAKIKLFEAMP